MYFCSASQVPCYYCGKRLRKDNHARHCRDKHASTPKFLKVGQRPVNPFCTNWEHYINNPEPMHLKPRENYQSEEEQQDYASDDLEDSSSN